MYNLGYFCVGRKYNINTIVFTAIIMLNVQTRAAFKWSWIPVDGIALFMGSLKRCLLDMVWCDNTHTHARGHAHGHTHTNTVKHGHI